MWAITCRARSGGRARGLIWKRVEIGGVKKVRVCTWEKSSRRRIRTGVREVTGRRMRGYTKRDLRRALTKEKVRRQLAKTLNLGTWGRVCITVMCTPFS